MVWRSLVMRTRSSRAALSTTGAAAAAGAAFGADIAFRTSPFITRPSLPVAVTSSRLMLFSAISFFADGASSTSLPPADAAGAAAGAAASALGAAAGAAPAPSVRVASRASTPTVSPSAATISPSVPAAGEGTSTVTLSVSSSHSISSTATASPGFLNQVATVASVTLSPKVGTRTSMLMAYFPSMVSASLTSASC